jgi:hypothetical protein
MKGLVAGDPFTIESPNLDNLIFTIMVDFDFNFFVIGHQPLFIGPQKLMKGLVVGDPFTIESPNLDNLIFTIMVDFDFNFFCYR